MSHQPTKTNLEPQQFKQRHVRAFPTFQKPHVVGYFSVDKDRKYLPSLDNLQYFSDYYLTRSERLSLDLNAQYDRYVPKPNKAADEKLDHLLQFIKTNFEEVRAKDADSSKLLDTDFVCFRGLLRLLMCTPYDTRDQWIILAMKCKGTIYLCEEKTEEKKMEQRNMNDRGKLLCSYGFKFEQYLLADSPTSPPQPDRPVIEAEEFCTMFKTKLEDTSILYGAEMDGVVSDKPLTNLSDLQSATLIELKVKQEERNQYHMQNFVNNKQIKWWCQSFLVGINDVYVGLRSAKGIVYKVEKHEVRSMPKIAREMVDDSWQPAVCMDFLAKFLRMVKDVMNEIDSDMEVVEFSYDPQKDQKVKYTKYEEPDESKIFLPRWYFEFLREKNKSKLKT